VEAVEVLFDPRVVSYEELLAQYWRNVDPFNDHGQFCDYGEQYRPVIFAHGPTQRQQAAASRERVEHSLQRPVAVAVVDGSAFYPAEGYHQNYHASNPVRYGYYSWACGRAQRLREVWSPF
jgi:peptide-methionine (S)-S-oxide reductase